MQGSCYKRVNANAGYAYGGEIRVEHSLSEILKMGVNYSFVKKKIKNFALMDGSSLDAKPINQPNHIFNAKITLKPRWWLEIIALNSFESARYYPNNNGYEKNRNYYTLDLSINLKPENGFIFSAGVLNLTDRDNYIGVNNLGIMNNLGSNNLGTTNLGANSNNLGVNNLGANNLGINSNNLGVNSHNNATHFAGRRFIVGFEFTY